MTKVFDTDLKLKALQDCGLIFYPNGKDGDPKITQKGWGSNNYQTDWFRTSPTTGTQQRWFLKEMIEMLNQLKALSQ